MQPSQRDKKDAERGIRFHFWQRASAESDSGRPQIATACTLSAALIAKIDWRARESDQNQMAKRRRRRLPFGFGQFAPRPRRSQSSEKLRLAQKHTHAAQIIIAKIAGSSRCEFQFAKKRPPVN